MSLTVSEEMKDRENLEQEENPSAVQPEVPDSKAEEAEAESKAAEPDAGEAAPEADEAAQKDAASEKEEKKGFFSKKKDKRDEQIEELTDRLKRNMAEFDNYRKRTEKEKAAMYEVGARSVIEKLLPIVDNFERGLAAVPEEEAKSAFAEGMDKIYKQVLKMLEDMGVKPIEAVGQPFDPNFHNAVMHVEDDEQGENVVVEEFQKGYMYHDSVVRHSMVKVAN